MSNVAQVNLSSRGSETENNWDLLHPVNTSEKIQTLRKECSVKRITAIAIAAISIVGIIAGTVFLGLLIAKTIVVLHTAKEMFWFLGSMGGLSYISSLIIMMPIIYLQQIDRADQLSKNRQFIDFAEQQGFALTSKNIMDFWPEFLDEHPYDTIQFTGIANWKIV